MARIRVKKNQSGVNAMMRTASVKAFVKENADKIANRANSSIEFHSPMRVKAYGSGVNQNGLGFVVTRKLGRNGSLDMAAYEHDHNNLKKSVGA